MKKSIALYILLILFTFTQINTQNLKKTPLKILVVLDKFPWYTKTIILNQIIGLLDHGHDVSIYAQKSLNAGNIDPVIEKYDLINKTYYEKLPSDLDYYDVILCQYGDQGKEFAQIKKEGGFTGKLVTCFRGSDVTSCKKASREEYRDLFEYGDLFLPVCDYFKYRLKLLGCNLKKTRVLYSGIDCSNFKYKKKYVKPGEPIYIISVNRLANKKGIIYAILAVSQLLKKHNNLKLKYLIIGEGRQRKNLESFIEAVGCKDQIKLIGWKTQKEIADYLNTSHLFILPSITSLSGLQEGIPNVLKEAMLSGLPVISTFHSGILELVENGVSGFLVPERDPDSLYLKLQYLVENPKIWKKMGIAGSKKVKQCFDIKKINKRLEKLLINLVNK